MRKTMLLAGLLGAAGLCGAGPAAAQCSAIGGAAGTVVSCPGGSGMVQTGPNGAATGMIGGQVFSGTDLGNGVIVGTLGGAPYTITGGLAPEPPAAVPFNPPPPIVLGEPPPLSLAEPPPISSRVDTATREAARRRAAYLAELRRQEAARAKRP